MRLQCDLKSYRKRLLMRRLPVVLVEGPSDRRALVALIERMTGLRRGRDYLVDDAEWLKSPDGKIFGNREKVEYYCTQLTRTSVAWKIVGFVDREFREFVHNGTLDDQLNSHRVIDRMVWSRGHSVENYFLDLRVLLPCFRNLSASSDVSEAVDKFVSVFPDLLRVACALTLAGLRFGNLDLVARSLEWCHFQIVADRLGLRVDRWVRSLERKHGLDATRSNRLGRYYRGYRGYATRVSVDVMRWFIHGHIAMAAVWQGFARCLYAVNGRNKREIDGFLSTQEGVRLAQCAELWAAAAVSDGMTAPTPVVEMLYSAWTQLRGREGLTALGGTQKHAG